MYVGYVEEILVLNWRKRTWKLLFEVEGLGFRAAARLQGLSFIENFGLKASL